MKRPFIKGAWHPKETDFIANFLSTAYDILRPMQQDRAIVTGPSTLTVPCANGRRMYVVTGERPLR
jgi:hypothetical protein